MQTKVNHKLVEFDNFSQAFRYAVDNKGVEHVDLYSKINMDKSQWSKLYNGDAENPRPSTVKKLSKVVGVDFKRKEKGKWVIENENTTSSNINPGKEQFRLAEEELDKAEEPSLDYLPQLVRLRDKLDEKIDRLVKKKRE